jgi:hypothetical protein
MPNLTNRQSEAHRLQNAYLRLVKAQIHAQKGLRSQHAIVNDKLRGAVSRHLSRQRSTTSVSSRSFSDSSSAHSRSTQDDSIGPSSDNTGFSSDGDSISLSAGSFFDSPSDWDLGADGDKENGDDEMDSATNSDSESEWCGVEDGDWEEGSMVDSFDEAYVGGTGLGTHAQRILDDLYSQRYREPCGRMPRTPPTLPTVLLEWKHSPTPTSFVRSSVSTPLHLMSS